MVCIQSTIKERWQHLLPLDETDGINYLIVEISLFSLRSKIPMLIRVQTNPFRVVCLQHESQPLHKRYLLPQRGETLPTIDECNRYYYNEIPEQRFFSEKSFSIQKVMVVIIRDQNESTMKTIHQPLHTAAEILNLFQISQYKAIFHWDFQKYSVKIIKCYPWMSVSGNPEMMHWRILINMPNYLECEYWEAISS